MACTVKRRRFEVNRVTNADITHYHRIVVALAETIRLMQEIDAVIAQHDGWPAAFVSSSAAQND